ncbi:response regulator transcription factor [Geodermatophilus sp. YIM 151500]|uniref:response regulator n=1 Tax=Geodermatophilus sp. YIM 151500 TaxID=2984531 RepID=UPI0021E3CBCA|nr:response regulator transcription factor [Geodermatophilus sp. YIM 151500]MCV2487986.1 response regulator transcription factor [Geodermatophilus sp. YIM 151500]
MTTRVLIADDTPLMRSAMRMCLDAEPDITVVGEAADGLECLRLVEQRQPDVVVMDVRMPILDGIETTRRLTARPDGHPVAVLVMTVFDVDENIIEALRAGARGFLVKDAPPDELVRAVRLLAAGEAILSPSITRRLLDLRGRTLPPIPTQARNAALASITARELTVLTLLARGLSNNQIATEMDLAPSSVKTHVGHLLAKLGLTDRVQLTVFAYENELVRPGSPHDPPPSHGP